METIVVGVDGSAASVDALRWALREAALRGAAVQVVHSWLPPTLAAKAPMAWDAEYLSLFRRDAETVVEDALDAVGEVPDGVVVEKAVIEGPAAQTLVEAAADASLLVVGSRGRGGFAELLLGSVSHHCVHHASCPVVVVRHVAVAAAPAERVGAGAMAD